VFHGSGNFFCFVCHGDKKKGERGASPYKGFKALGMPEDKARKLFLQGSGTLFSDTIVYGRAPSLDAPVLPTQKWQEKPKMEKVASRSPWPVKWGFRGLKYATLTAPWFKKRFEPSKVTLTNEKIPRIAFSIGGAEAYKDTENPDYLRHEVFLRLSSAVKAKAINSPGLNFDHNILFPRSATLFGLINNKLTKGSRGLFLVEGPYDALYTYQHLYRPEIGGKFDVVALLGTPQWPKVFGQLRAFVLLELIKRDIPLILAFDNDVAGHKLIKTAVNDLKHECPIPDERLMILNYPSRFKDPGDLPFNEFYQCLQNLGLLTPEQP
jgi:hypothetical protein